MWSTTLNSPIIVGNINFLEVNALNLIMRINVDRIKFQPTLNFK